MLVTHLRVSECLLRAAHVVAVDTAEYLFFSSPDSNQIQLFPLED